MERFCDTCGSLISSAAEKCPFCGTQQEVSAVSLAKHRNAPAECSQPDVPQQPAVTTGMTGAAGGISPDNRAVLPDYNRSYNTTAQQPAQESMSLGSWILTIFLTHCLGPVSIVLLAVWGFAAQAKEPRKTYCRAMLCLLPITGFGMLFGNFVGLAVLFNLLGISL